MRAQKTDDAADIMDGRAEHTERGPRRALAKGPALAIRTFLGVRPPAGPSLSGEGAMARVPRAVRLRGFRAGDAPALHAIFHRAVRDGTRSLYSPAERRAWSPAPAPPPWWAGRFRGQITVVALHDGAPCGFMTLGRDGHLDFAYVLPAFHGTGIAARLHDEILRRARRLGLRRLETEASLIGRRFFLKHGWSEGARTVHRFGDETLSAMRMTRVV